MSGLFVSAILTLWLLVSILGQLPQFQVQKQRWKHFGLIPTWQFFTNPLATKDIVLLYRITPAENLEWSEWQEIALEPARTWYGALWHPQRRLSKAFLDIASLILIMRVRAKLDRALIQQSVPYRTTLGVVKSRATIAHGKRVQFALQLAGGEQERSTNGLLFLSDIHSA